MAPPLSPEGRNVIAQIAVDPAAVPDMETSEVLARFVGVCILQSQLGAMAQAGGRSIEQLLGADHETAAIAAASAASAIALSREIDRRMPKGE